jgi:predicted transcriptional regulator
VVELLDAGLSHAEAGRRLGITQSAVSQRAQAAAVVVGRRAARLVGQLLAAILEDDTGTAERSEGRR